MKISLFLTICVLGPIIILQLASISHARPSYQVPCSKCKFDVSDDHHSLCSFGCSTSYTIKTNIPADLDLENKNAALLALAKKILPLLTEFKKSVRPRRRHLENLLNEGLARGSSGESPQVRLKVQDFKPSFGDEVSEEEAPVYNFRTASNYRNRDGKRPIHHKKIFSVKTEDNIEEEEEYSKKDERPLRRFLHVDAQQKQRNDIIEDDIIEIPRLPSDRKQYENNRKPISTTTTSTSTTTTTTANSIDWDDQSFTLDEVQPKPKPKKSSDEKISYTGFAGESDDDFNEIPDDNQDNRVKGKILPNTNQPNLMEMFYNDDSYVLDSKRVKKD